MRFGVGAFAYPFRKSLAFDLFAQIFLTAISVHYSIDHKQNVIQEIHLRLIEEKGRSTRTFLN